MSNSFLYFIEGSGLNTFANHKHGNMAQNGHSFSYNLQFIM